MTVITNEINKRLNKKNLNIYQLSKLIVFSEGALRKMISVKSPFSEKAVEKLLPILDISREEFESWIIADKYSKEIIKHAIQVKKEWPYKRKSVLTNKIDKILDEKDMSRTALAKQIGYAQSGLNRMIIGKINMSKPVLEKISKVLDISQDEITSWIVADKYSLQLLEQAYSYKS